jgi:tetratricopeptide (TPR) repeat protein
MSRSVGHLLRTIYIEAELKDAVNCILRAPSHDDASVEWARAEIRGMARKGNPYACGTQVRAYLEEKTRVGTEPWVFPVAGELFLDGLEAQLERLGPNLMKDYYGGALACYKAGHDSAACAQAPFYCVDLLLKRMLMLFLKRTEADQQPQTAALRFMQSEAPGYQEQMQTLQTMADQVLAQGVEILMSFGRGKIDGLLAEHLTKRTEDLRNVLKRWRALLRSPLAAQGPSENDLPFLLEQARDLGYPPLEAFVREELSAAAAPDSAARDLPPAEDPFLVHAYEGGETWMFFGNAEREEGAYMLAERRYRRSIALFHSIHDRTSEAKAHVERARALMQQGGDRLAAREALHMAVRLVLAHKRSLPEGTLPDVADELALSFLEKKGYTPEANAYRAALAMVRPRPF